MNWGIAGPIFVVLALAYAIVSFWFFRASKNQPRLSVNKITQISNFKISGEKDMLLTIDNIGDGTVMKIECLNFKVSFRFIPTPSKENFQIVVEKNKLQELAKIGFLKFRFKGTSGIGWWYTEVPIRFADGLIGANQILDQNLKILRFIPLPS